ncbi:MAG: hypothetical protein JNM63_17370 [Spirochaetia bacterium]|nr:hypothetical protein [Spirochaetia bacterium]
MNPFKFRFLRAALPVLLALGFLVPALPAAQLDPRPLFLGATQTNRGFIFDLFNGGGSSADSYTLLVTQNGRPMTNYTSLGNNLWLVEDMFYNVPATNTVCVVYSGPTTIYGVYNTNTGVKPTAITNNWASGGSAAARTLANFEFKAVFPDKVFPSDTSLVVEFPTKSLFGSEQYIGQAYNEMLLYDVNGKYTNLTNLFQITFNVRVSNDTIIVPGYSASNPSIANQNLLSLGLWNGRKWAPIPTTYSLSTYKLSMSAQLSELGRVGILFAGSVDQYGGEPKLQIASRLLILNSTDPLYNQLVLTYPNERNDPVTFAVFDIAGRMVYNNLDDKTYQPDRTGNTIRWNAKVKTTGASISPGVYLYVVKVGNSDLRNFKGTFVVMGQ